MNYHSTPHCTIGISPDELLFNRKIRNKLPAADDSISSQDNGVHQKATERDARQKEKMKTYADKRNHAKKIEFRVGDYVLVKQDKQSKLSTPFSKSTYKITAIKGSMITATGSDRTITRNVSMFKRVPAPKQASQDEEPYISDCDDIDKATTDT